jgi:hypothetical protein
MDPELARQHPRQVLFILNALKDAKLCDAMAELEDSRSRNRSKFSLGCAS